MHTRPRSRHLLDCLVLHQGAGGAGRAGLGIRTAPRKAESIRCIERGEIAFGKTAAGLGCHIGGRVAQLPHDRRRARATSMAASMKGFRRIVFAKAEHGAIVRTAVVSRIYVAQEINQFRAVLHRLVEQDVEAILAGQLDHGAESFGDIRDAPLVDARQACRSGPRRSARRSCRRRAARNGRARWPQAGNGAAARRRRHGWSGSSDRRAFPARGRTGNGQRRACSCQADCLPVRPAPLRSLSSGMVTHSPSRLKTRSFISAAAVLV
jgi:hypothetical protein